MRVLFTATNWKGIYFCMVPLGWALQAAGHEVRVACAPAQAEAIGAAGLTAAPVLEGFELMRVERMSRYAAAVRSPGAFAAVPPVHPETGQPVADYGEYDVAAHEEDFARRYRATLGRNCDAAVEFARAWRPDLVVHDLMTPEGVLAALATGVPSVYHSPGMFGSVEASLHDPTGAFARHGVHGWDRSQIAYAIDPSPDELAPDMGTALRLPVRYVPYNGPGAMEPWLLERPERPRICMIWGNSASGIFGTGVPALRHAIDAVTAAGAELLLTVAPEQAAALGPVPDGVRLLSDHPLHLLLEHSDAVIHQGSVNPMMTAAGLPQLVLSLTDDQIEIGRRFARGGSALLLPGLTATAEQIREAVTRLLTDSALRTAALRVKSGIDRHPTAARLVPALERLARTGTLTAEDLPR
ncbi:nucleotide disphospho-sugar-binding domain-containing protein [Streptomyces sp. NPDC023838]|uniref:nucleotide disphospho-sugar-binding domain-containing protein n=1 Tax=Streptomyces sp. NPDC023838 TaxID=3154325 RepID=UPI003402DD25